MGGAPPLEVPLKASAVAPGMHLGQKMAAGKPASLLVGPCTRDGSSPHFANFDCPPVDDYMWGTSMRGWRPSPCSCSTTRCRKTPPS